ncbi:hypothetical protein CDQ84_05640 [Clostridium thermosuccinogenes]|uniref:Lipoprotein n=1 Tax=Clostridium thermosuccinogenes TaxID=84032 RepID=A0A2K2FP58_9CLOT|nr:hypothetical protein [Pseudoclostridium thermosuccinogenes]AUS96748.1 hypothetical protein CDO33_10035 [Pseudoclostridium thermosuccinogenes]PNT97671.1 hypothetical protein CDQ85_07815 [Pseudoclostridium thermosuccinogenes]PNU00565.1 hypothetical protein CDQ84_05640 [Pseudoclostridium thermosuccinogenes]
MKRIKLIAAIAFLLCGLIFAAWYKQPKTPLAALEKGYMGKQDSILMYCALIEQVDINQNKSLLFYYNGRGNVNCAVAEKKIAGYRIVDVNAELAPYHEDLRVGLYGSTYDKGKKWVYFGIIYDDSVDKVVWNNIEGVRFSSSDMDMVYAVGDGDFKGNEYHIYDADGNELEHHRS